VLEGGKQARLPSSLAAAFDPDTGGPGGKPWAQVAELLVALQRRRVSAKATLLLSISTGVYLGGLGL